MSDWPYQYFTKEEVSCKCGCGKLPTTDLMRWLENLRYDWGGPITPTSVARCFKHNLKVAGVSDSMHVFGLAVDIPVYGEDAHELLKLGLSKGARGVGIYQSNTFKSNRFIHFDLRLGKKAIWSK